MKLLILLSLLTFAANAATTGTLNLSGVVATTFAIVVNPQSAATNLDIVNGETNVLVATVDETSNNSAGYKISLSSANSGKLKNGSIDEVTYTLSYDGGSATTPTGSLVSRKTSGTLTGLITDNSEVRISFTGKANALAGSYTDTITFEIAAP